MTCAPLSHTQADPFARAGRGTAAVLPGMSGEPEGPGSKGAARTKTSRFRGLAWHRKASKWHVRIKAVGHPRYLGHFDSEEEAARVYDRAAFYLHGRWAS